ncbi:hypothetical protein V502_03114 [Pseudogymnoascus sp. VKM F-4520 (FW-2644)]|nr:hypothetical protein V502_03114 [Pseudogymnoascus sp. VKM F-4520 (FW-2644)]
MQFSTFALWAILASAVNALTNIPPVSLADAQIHTVNLFNGVNTTTATVGRPGMAMLAGGRKNMCAGSVRCTNEQGFRDECRTAYTKIDVDVVYTTDSNGAGGVCSGKCGFFLEGRGCRATYEEFEAAYLTIRHTNNCLTCGYAFKPRTNEKCWIKFDYVSHC